MDLHAIPDAKNKSEERLNELTAIFERSVNSHVTAGVEKNSTSQTFPSAHAPPGRIRKAYRFHFLRPPPNRVQKQNVSPFFPLGLRPCPNPSIQGVDPHQVISKVMHLSCHRLQAAAEV